MQLKNTVNIEKKRRYSALFLRVTLKQKSLNSWNMTYDWTQVLAVIYLYFPPYIKTLKLSKCDSTLRFTVIQRPFIQKTFNCSKSIIKIHYKKMWNMFKINNKDTTTTLMTSLWCLYCLLWKYFIPVFSVSIVDFGQVNVFWRWCAFKSLVMPRSFCYAHVVMFQDLL